MKKVLGQFKQRAILSADMSNKQNENQTRESWLLEAVHAMEPWFISKGYNIPAIRVSCGWPSARGLKSTKTDALGECWDKSAASDEVAQIFISPRLKEETGLQGTLSVLVHEVCHAVVGNEAGHGKVFGKCARAVGLEGKLTATVAGEVLTGEMAKWLADLGPYPHAVLDPGARSSGRKPKQTTRQVKCECEACGYTVRVSRKWLNEVGAPLCPCNKNAMAFEIPDELAGDDDAGGDE